MAIEFEIEDRRIDPATHVVVVRGEIDLFTAPEFKQRVTAPIASGADHVVVDLMETTFIDSASLGVLIGANRRLKARGGRLVVACDNEAILKTFRITGLDGVFTLAPTVDAQDDVSRARRAARADPSVCAPAARGSRLAAMSSQEEPCRAP